MNNQGKQGKHTISTHFHNRDTNRKCLFSLLSLLSLRLNKMDRDLKSIILILIFCSIISTITLVGGII